MRIVNNLTIVLVSIFTLLFISTAVQAKDYTIKMDCSHSYPDGGLISLTPSSACVSKATWPSEWIKSGKSFTFHNLDDCDYYLGGAGASHTVPAGGSGELYDHKKKSCLWDVCITSYTCKFKSE